MSNYKFTFIALATNGEHFRETVESIILSTKKLTHTQLIICDTVCSDETKDAIKLTEGLSGVLKIDCKSLTAAQAFNKSLPEILGEYTIFAEEGVIYNKKSHKALDTACTLYNESHLTMAAVTLTKEEKEKKYARFPIERNGAINLNELPYFGHTALSTFAFITSQIKGVTFDETIFEECKKKFVLEALCKNPSVYVIEKHTIFHKNALENDNDQFAYQYNEWYYTPSLKYFMIPFMKNLTEATGEVPKFVQYALSQLILAKYANNYYENDKGVLTEKQAYEFYDATCEALGFIDNSIFTEAAIRCKYVVRSLWAQLLFGKMKKAGLTHTLALQNEEEVKKDPELNFDDRSVYLTCDGNENARITTLKNIKLSINQINYQGGMLEFDAEFTGKDFIPADEIELFAEFVGKKIKLEEYPIYPLLKCFGLPYAKKYPVHFFIPVTEDLKEISFGYNLCGEYHKLSFRFQTQFSRLRLRFGKSYWKFCDSDNLALEAKGNYTLNIFKCTGFKHFKREIALYISMFLNTKNLFFAFQCVALRLIYRLTKPLFKKERIFITFDKLYKAGDNGEYFWRYANTIDDNIETYYVISDTSLDCKRLKEYDKKHTVIHNSLKCRLLALNAEAIVATHTMVMQYCGFPKYLHPYFLDLWNVKVICIQHGLTVQQLAQYQRRTYDNTTLYCLASKYEKKNLMHPVYGYKEEMLKLNGLARYDGLKNNDKKEILITPTWRRNVVSKGIAYKKKPYNELFKTTEYFRLYNELIHDEKLIDTAKKHGYGITYLLHPAMSPQLEDFDNTGYVKVIAASGDMNYEEILTQASLMVTDYSGVQFDFAYMRKPIVYYHPNTLPPHYESGGINYNTQGFGPICADHKTLVDTVCGFLESSCQPLQEYKLRADDFFEFDDFNNCKRIYEEILDSLK
ncbi:MAG: hypothetical protein E7566_07750 [Ruminococcaceae bacterium]|nr:hypothetical protein [Oscillospiraceae bacterium]